MCSPDRVHSYDAAVINDLLDVVDLPHRCAENDYSFKHRQEQQLPLSALDFVVEMLVSLMRELCLVHVFLLGFRRCKCDKMFSQG